MALIIIKLINPDKKSIFETYVLREVGAFNISTPLQLKEHIFKQFGDQLVSSRLDFPVGYIKAGSKVWIRTDADIKDVWSFISKGDTISFWCHGINISEDVDDNEESPTRKPKRKKRRKTTYMEEKNERVDGLVSQLREKHGELYNGVQYCLWAYK